MSAEKQKHTEEPWEAEPDEKTFIHVGLNCTIRRHDELKHLCGYVEISKGHLLYQRDYNDIYTDHNIDVHGGLTFSGSADWLGEKDSYWIGFDCAHLDDLSPGIPVFVTKRGTYKNMGYVTAEVKSLAEQVATLAEAKKSG